MKLRSWSSALIGLALWSVLGLSLRSEETGFPSAPSGAAQSSQPWIQKINLYDSGSAGYELYRIPGLVVTARGAVIADCDARRTDKFVDWADIDISMRRSTDGGATWSPPRLICDWARLRGQGFKIEQNPVALLTYGPSVQGKLLFNNQLPVVDRATGAVFMFFCVNYNRCFVERSDDDGAAFGPARELTSVLDGYRPEYPWKCIATGPNHGIQLRSGRLLVPVWMSISGGLYNVSFYPSVAATIYSDDHGQTWHRGAIIATAPLVNPGETVLVELTNGGVMASMRSQPVQNRRGVSYSFDGISSWTTPEFINDLVDIQCMAGLERLSTVAKDGKARLIYSFCDNATDAFPSNIAGRGLKRENLTVALSYDEGRTWPVRRTIEPGWAGYSDLAVTADGTIYCFYENGSLDDSGRGNRNAHLTLARFNLAWITQGRDHL